MDVNDITFVPHSDMELNDQTIVEQHLVIYKNNQYNNATNFLNDNNYTKGFRASLFNNMENKLRNLQEYLLGKESDEDSEEVITTTEPSLSGDSSFWLLDY